MEVSTSSGSHLKATAITLYAPKARDVSRSLAPAFPWLAAGSKVTAAKGSPWARLDAPSDGGFYAHPAAVDCAIHLGAVPEPDGPITPR